MIYILTAVIVAAIVALIWARSEMTWGKPTPPKEHKPEGDEKQ